MEKDSAPDVDVKVVEVTDHLRGSTLDTFQDDLSRLMEAGHVRVVIDMVDFDHADSAGLGYLVKLQAELGSRGGSCAIARPNAEFRRLINITGLDMILPVFDSIDAAIDHLS